MARYAAVEKTIMKRGRRWLNPIDYMSSHYSAGGAIAWVVHAQHGKQCPSACLSISDCNRKVELDVCIEDDDYKQRTLDKIEIMIEELTKCRDAILEVEFYGNSDD